MILESTEEAVRYVQTDVEQVHRHELPEPQPQHVHDYREVPRNERTDRLRFVCAMYRCIGCGDSYKL